MNDPFVSGFFKTLRILKDYLSEIVIGGGWAPFIYYRSEKYPAWFRTFVNNLSLYFEGPSSEGVLWEVIHVRVVFDSAKPTMDVKKR